MPGTQLCTICSSPIVAEINAALDRGEKLRPLAARSGFSKASLSRHNRKCRARLAIAEFKARNRKNSPGRVIVAWPPDSCPDELKNKYTNFYGDDTPIAASDLRPDDVLFTVQYAPPLPPRDPQPQTPAEEIPPEVLDSLQN